MLSKLIRYAFSCSIAIKYIHQAKEKLRNETTSNTRERSVLDKLLFIDEQTACVMALDMLTAGVDTVNNNKSVYYIII